MDWTPFVVIILTFSPMLIFVFMAGLHLIYRLLSYESFQEYEILESQKRKEDLENLSQVLEKHAPIVYRAIFHSDKVGRLCEDQ